MNKRLLNNKLFQYFYQTFTLDIFQNWNLILSKFLKKTEDFITISHCKKRKILGIFETSNTRIKVYNLSSKTLDQKLNEILDKGPMFDFATNKYNEKDDQIEAEYLYNQISEISKNNSCNGNIKRFSETFGVLCKSYIRNKKNGTIKNLNGKQSKPLPTMEL